MPLRVCGAAITTYATSESIEVYKASGSKIGYQILGRKKKVKDNKICCDKKITVKFCWEFFKVRVRFNASWCGMWNVVKLVTDYSCRSKLFGGSHDPQFDEKSARNS